MTRFATFWVEDGELAAPVSVLRFDDTLYRLFGDRLEALTDRAELILDSSTYERRSTASIRVPGALVSAHDLHPVMAAAPGMTRGVPGLGGHVRSEAA